MFRIENFPQAVQDYTEALKLKSALLPPSSRALASVHYQLATVLEFTPSGRAGALTHVQAALAGFQARLAELAQLANGSSTTSEELSKMSEKEREHEKKDVEALIGDLEVKIEELKSAPQQGEEGVDPVSESIKHLLGGVGEGAFGPSSAGGSAGASAFGTSGEAAPVNDLTSMVKKKKKPVQAAQTTAPAVGGQVDVKGKGLENGEKRKAEEPVELEAKKAKTE
jgi:HAT1-interacting factor 1